MSNSALTVPLHATRESRYRAGQQNSNQENRNLRNPRSSGKGRRRRAAAEQRRIEQQRWGQYTQGSDEEDFIVSHRVGNGRRAGRSSRLARDELDDNSTNASHDDNLSLDFALALSLSLSDSGENGHLPGPIRHEVLDMTYENLVLLEDIKCVASSAVVGSLFDCIYEESTHDHSSSFLDELCVICQSEYESGDHLILLSCAHSFHHACGSEWLLNYSKLCPVCKHDATE
eukprot:c25501_g1_i1 orf=552-1241(+)